MYCTVSWPLCSPATCTSPYDMYYNTALPAPLRVPPPCTSPYDMYSTILQCHLAPALTSQIYITVRHVLRRDSEGWPRGQGHSLEVQRKAAGDAGSGCPCRHHHLVHRLRDRPVRRIRSRSTVPVPASRAHPLQRTPLLYTTAPPSTQQHPRLRNSTLKQVDAAVT